MRGSTCRRSLLCPPPFSWPHFNTMRQVKNIIKESPIQHVSSNETIACQVNMSSSESRLAPVCLPFWSRLGENSPSHPRIPSSHQCPQVTALAAGIDAFRYLTQSVKHFFITFYLTQLLGKLHLLHHSLCTEQSCCPKRCLGPHSPATLPEWRKATTIKPHTGDLRHPKPQLQTLPGWNIDT